MAVNRVGRNKFAYCQVIVGLVASLGLVLALAPIAEAHKVYVFAWVEGNTVHTESYFGSNSKVQDGVVRVYDIAGKKLLEGRTNKQGEFVFDAPQQTDLRIVIEAGMGHRGEYLLKAEEFSGVLDKESKPANHEEDKDVPASPVAADAEKIRNIVEQALDARLKPIIRELAAGRKEKGPGITEIIGGIGYIFGLMGVIMYFMSKKKK